MCADAVVPKTPLRRAILRIVAGLVVMALSAWASTCTPSWWLWPSQYWRGAWGLMFVAVGGTFLVWGLITDLAWGVILRSQRPASDVVSTMLLAALERVSFMVALILGFYVWVGVWLALKMAARWPRAGESDPLVKAAGPRTAGNLWLIGNLLSVLISALGAWVSLGRLPRPG